MPQHNDTQLVKIESPRVVSVQCSQEMIDWIDKERRPLRLNRSSFLRHCMSQYAEYQDLQAPPYA